MTLKSCLVLFSIKPMITLTNLRKKTAKRISGGRIRERAGFRTLRKVSAIPRNSFRTPQKVSATPRNGFRTPQKGFAMARGPSELFGNASRRREELQNSSETLRGIAKWFPHTAEGLSFWTPSPLRASPPSEGGAPRRGEGVQNSGAA